MPSAKLAVSVKPAPLLNGVGFRSAPNTKKAPPSATGRLTVPLPAFTSAPSRLVVVPSAQYDVAGSVSQMPPPLVWRKSSLVTVRGQIPPWTVTRNVASSAPSEANAVGPGPTLSRDLPRNASVIVGDGGTIVKPPLLMTTWPSAFTTVTSRAPSVAAVPIVRATDS